MKDIDGKYQIVRKLGQGGMGSVFEATHRSTGRHVAIKVILEEARLDPLIVSRFEREARAAGSIELDHITQVLDAGVDAETGAPYLAMEMLSGEDAATLAERLGPLRPDLALRIVHQLLEGLERAHEAGIVHRDIKPANVFLARKPKSTEVVVKICDFGIAKVKSNVFGATEDPGLTQSSVLLGSPIYMSPEQAKGSRDVDPRTDLWSTGVVLYKLLTGTTPHPEADTLGLLLLAICSEPTPPVGKAAPWVTPGIEAVVARALVIERDLRFGSAEEMKRAIAELLPGGTALDESMFVRMTEAERDHAPVVLAPSFALSATTPSGGTLRDEPPREPPAESAPSLAETPAHAVPPPPRRGLRAIGAGVAIAAATAAAVIGLRGNGSSASNDPTHATSATASPVVLPPAPLASPPRDEAPEPPTASAPATPATPGVSRAAPSVAIRPATPAAAPRPGASARSASSAAPVDSLRRTFE